MQTWSWLLFCCVCFVLADDEKILEPLQWQGGLTKMAGGRTSSNGVSTRVQFYKNEIFACMPRLKEGSEVTLARTVMPENPDIKPILEPYPPGKPQTEGDCSCLQSVVDIYLDDANILWALDVGSFKVGAPGQPPVSRCTPKIFGINVENGQVDHIIQLSPFIQPGSRFQFIVADYSEEGNGFLYISDAGTKSIIVYDVMNNKGHRVVLPDNVLPNPYGVRDVLYLALIKKPTGNFLYFTYRSSDNMFCIETKFLQKDASSAKSWDVGKKPGKLILLGTDEGLCVYFRYVDKADVFKWNTVDPFTEAHFHLVHTGGQLTPTHACPDFERGLMKVCESNLPQYLNPNVKQNDSLNSITVMQVV